MEAAANCDSRHSRMLDRLSVENPWQPESLDQLINPSDSIYARTLGIRL